MDADVDSGVETVLDGADGDAVGNGVEGVGVM